MGAPGWAGRPGSERTRSSLSTMTMATGRSLLSDSRWLVWMSEEAPKPSMPGKTLAPARPALVGAVDDLGVQVVESQWDPASGSHLHGK